MESKTSSVIRTERISDDEYSAFYENGVWIGDILRGDDGYFVWDPVRDRNGFIDEGFLFAMANLLKDMNKEWDEIVQNDPSIGHGEHNMERGEPV